MQEDKERRTAPSDTDSGELSRVQSLAADEHFHLFFTTSVIEVPEEMRKIDHTLTEDEAEPKKRRKGGWLRSLFGRGRDEEAEEAAVAPQEAPETDTGEVLLAGPETGEVPLAGQETGEISLTAAEPEAEEEAGEVRLDAAAAAQPAAPARQKKTAKRPDSAAAVPARKEVPPAEPPAPAPVPEPLDSAMAAQPAPAPAADTAAPDAARQEKPAAVPPRRPKPEKTDSRTDIDRLLRRISAQEALTGKTPEPLQGSLAAQQPEPAADAAAPVKAPEAAEEAPARAQTIAPAAEVAPDAGESLSAPAAAEEASAPAQAFAPAEAETPAPAADVAPTTPAAAPSAAAADLPAGTEAAVPAAERAPRRDAVSDLLEKIDETQAAVGRPAAPWAARPVSRSTRDAVRKLEEKIAALTRQEGHPVLTGAIHMEPAPQPAAEPADAAPVTPAAQPQTAAPAPEPIAPAAEAPAGSAAAGPAAPIKPEAAPSVQPAAAPAAPAQTKPAAPAETQPAETQPAGEVFLAPAEEAPAAEPFAASSQTKPAAPAETQPAETEPAGEVFLAPAEEAPAAEPFAAPAQTKPAATAETQPAETEPAGEVFLAPAEEASTANLFAASSQTKPAATAETQPAETQPAGEVFLAPAEEPPAAESFAASAQTKPAAPAETQPAETEPTGEVFLAPAEEAPAAEPFAASAQTEAPAESDSPADGAGGDVDVQLIPDEAAMPPADTAEEAADASEPADTAAPDETPAAKRRWNPLLRLFGSEEPEDAALDEADEETADAPAADAADTAAAGEAAPLEYTSPEDADAVRAALDGQCAWLGLRLALSGILAAALLILDLMGGGVLPAPGVLNPATAPAAWLGVHLLALAAAGAVSWPVLRAGAPALLPGGTASAAVLPTLALGAAAVQVICGLLLPKDFAATTCTMFSGVAALQLFACTLGQWLTARTTRDSFALLASGVEHHTAYRLQDQHLTDFLCQGMEEETPVVLLSRPGSLLKNFLALCREPHGSDRQAVELGRILGGAALLALILTLVRGGDAVTACTALAAVVCMGTPLSAMLARAVPAARMQQAAGEVGAVVPGWPGVAQLGDVDVIQVDAADLFPPACARLYGIKTFQKERIDRAILYATGILIAGCNTLSGLFRNMIENKTEMLYPVKDLEVRCGQGYVAWCDNCRVLLGTREMMAAEGIPLPAKDYEDRYTQNGDRQLLYLAVSGKLYAMFLFGYNGAKKVARTLGVLRRENIRLLVTAQDPTLTAARIEECYRLRPGFVKVLDQAEQDKLAPATAYLPATEGCMAHLDGLTSLVGGLQAAAGAERAERAVCTVQMVSVVLTVLLGLLLSLVQGLAGLSLPAVLLYQLAWSALGIALTLVKKY